MTIFGDWEFTCLSVAGGWSRSRWVGRRRHLAPPPLPLAGAVLWPPGRGRSRPQRRGLSCRPPGRSPTSSTRSGRLAEGSTSGSCCGPPATRPQRVCGSGGAGGHDLSSPRASVTCDLSSPRASVTCHLSSPRASETCDLSSPRASETCDLQSDSADEADWNLKKKYNMA